MQSEAVMMIIHRFGFRRGPFRFYFPTVLPAKTSNLQVNWYWPSVPRYDLVFFNLVPAVNVALFIESEIRVLIIHHYHPSGNIANLAQIDRLPRKPSLSLMPPLLGGAENVSWMVYPKEFIAAEKLETFYSRGSANSRAKDVYDLLEILPQCLEKKELIGAIDQTFKNRKTVKPSSWSEVAKGFDKTMLSSAWPGITTQTEDSPNFSDAWERLINLLSLLGAAYQKSK